MGRYGLGLGLGKRRRVGAPPVPPMLNAITIASHNTFPENAAPTSVVCNLAGRTSGSTLTLFANGGGRFSISDVASQIIYDGGALDFETEPTINVTVRETRSGSPNSPLDSVITLTVSDVPEGGDATAPILTSAIASQTGETTADLGVTTNEANGTLYWVVTTNVTAPSKAQVKAGQNHLGAAAADSGSQVVSSIGAKTAGADGLAPGGTFYAHFMHEDAATNQSTVASSASFTTASPLALATPVLTRTSAAGANAPDWSFVMADLQDGDTIELDWTSNGAAPDGTAEESHIAEATEESITWATWPATFAPSTVWKLTMRYGRQVAGVWYWSNWAVVLTDTVDAAAGNSTKYRYYHLEMLTVGGGNFAAISEVSIADTAGGPDLSGNAVSITSNGHFGGLSTYMPPNVVDNNVDSIFHSTDRSSAGWPSVINFDFGAVAGNQPTANEFKVSSRNDGNHNQAPVNYRWRGSNDGVLATSTILVNVVGAAWPGTTAYTNTHTVP